MRAILFLTTLDEFLGIQSRLPESAHPKLFLNQSSRGLRSIMCHSNTHMKNV